jgi:hypothetical protein
MADHSGFWSLASDQGLILLQSISVNRFTGKRHHEIVGATGPLRAVVLVNPSITSILIEDLPTITLLLHIVVDLIVLNVMRWLATCHPDFMTSSADLDGPPATVTPPGTIRKMPSLPTEARIRVQPYRIYDYSLMMSRIMEASFQSPAADFILQTPTT